MNRLKLRKGQSLLSYIRNSIDVPTAGDLWPATLMSRNAPVRLVRELNLELLEQFSTLLINDGHCMCDVQTSTLIRAARLPWCHIVLAIPTDAPGLVVGGIIMVELLHSEMSYIAALCVRKDFRGKRIASTLFEEFQQMVNERVAFCDIPKMQKIHLRPPHFPFRMNYSILKLVGYAENILDACKQVMTALKQENRYLRLELRKFNDIEFNNIVEFDARIAGRNRYSALDEIQHVRGFRGVLLVNVADEIIGYSIAHETQHMNELEFRIGPLYALNLFAAVRILSEVCRPLKPDRMISIYVPDTYRNAPIQRLLQGKALCEVELQFDRYVTMKAETPIERLDNVYAVAAQILLPDC